MEMLYNGQLIAEVVPTNYTIAKTEEAKITACGEELSVQILLTSNDDMLVVFKSIHDMLAFDGQATRRLGAKNYSQIKIQHMTKDITYANKFKPADFEKYIRRWF